jgi:hypothetical protein
MVHGDGAMVCEFGSRNWCCGKDVACCVCAVREIQTNVKLGSRFLHVQSRKARL